jgi:nucleotide-binding universal stress UspA family protein
MPGIIVGVDGSTLSRRALEWAIKEAASRQTPLTVVTVHQTYRGFWNPGVDFPGDDVLVAAASKAVQEETDEALAKLPEDARPPEVNVMAVDGQPADRILRAAASVDADMIVLGSRGAGGFAKLLMGSVATQVSHHAHCPVMVVRPETEPTA